MTLPISNSSPEFWRMLDALIESSAIIIDRPKHSRHPRYPDFIYPVDYGYLEGTSSMDGEGVDLWLGNADERKLTALFVSVDPKKRDAEIKLVIGCTEEEIAAIDRFFNGYGDSMKALLIYRED